MIMEIAQIEVKPGSETAFEAAVQKAVPLFKASEGCISMELQRSIEKPQRYRLMVQWNTLEDHTVKFRGSDAFQQWRALISPHFVAPPEVEHTQSAVQGF